MAADRGPGYEASASVSHAARDYCAKLQHQVYTERRTPNNNIKKIAIQLTSVGLAHARPNYVKK